MRYSACTHYGTNGQFIKLIKMRNYAHLLTLIKNSLFSQVECMFCCRNRRTKLYVQRQLVYSCSCVSSLSICPSLTKFT